MAATDMTTDVTTDVTTDMTTEMTPSGMYEWGCSIQDLRFYTCGTVYTFLYVWYYIYVHIRVALYIH